MWNPLNSPITFEEFDSNDLSGLSVLQSVHDGSIRLVQYHTGNKTYQSRLPKVPVWNLSVDFSYSGQEYSYFTPYTGASTTNAYKVEEGSLVIDVISGAYAYLQLSNSSPYAITGLSGDFTIEFAASVEGGTGVSNSITGISSLGVYVRTYNTHEYFELHPTGVHFHYHPELDTTLDLRTRKNIRIGTSGSQLFFYAEPGFGMVSSTGWNRNANVTGQPLVILGNPFNSSISGNLSGFSGNIEFDSFRLYSGSFPLDDGFLGRKYYSTSTQTAYTDWYNPQFSVVNWNVLRVISDAVFGGGTTTVTAETKHGEDGSTTSPGVSAAISSQAQVINLSTIPVFGDGNDFIRFKIEQVSTDGTTAPPAITTFVLSSVHENAYVDLKPSWGTYLGNNLVAAQLNTENISNFSEQRPSVYDTIFLNNRDYANTTYIFDDRGTSGHVSATGFGQLSTGTYVFGTGISGYVFQNFDFDEPYIPAGALNTDPNSAYFSGNPSGLAYGIYGSIATGEFVPVSGQNVNDLYLYKDVSYDTEGNPKYAQGVFTNASGVGFGVNLTGIVSGASYRFISTLKIDSDTNISFNHGSSKWTLDYLNYRNYASFGAIFNATGATGQVSFLSESSSPTRWSVDSIDMDRVNLGTITFSGISFSGHNYTNLSGISKTGENLYLDTRFKLLGISNTNTDLVSYTTSAGTNTLKLSIDKNSYPIFNVNTNYSAYSGSTSVSIAGPRIIVTGVRPLPYDQYIHLGAGISHSYWSGNIEGARVFIAQDGQVIGSYEYDVINQLDRGSGNRAPVIRYTDGVPVLDSNYVVFGSNASMEVDWLRISSIKSSDPEFMGQKKAGYGFPYFAMDTWYVPRSQNAIVLRAANNDGALVSDSIHRVPFISTNPNGWIVLEEAGAYSKVNYFDSIYKSSAYCKIPSILLSNIGTGTSGSFAFGTWLTWAGQSGTIFSITKNGPQQTLAGQEYLSFDIREDGNFLLKSATASSTGSLQFSGLSTSLVSYIPRDKAISIDENKHVHLGLVINGNTSGLLFSIDGLVRHTGSYSIPNPLTGAKESHSGWYFSVAAYNGTGSFLTCSLEETFLDVYHTGYFALNAFSGIADPDLAKSSPSDVVSVNMNYLTGNKLVHLGPNIKYLVMPSGQGDVPVWVGTNGYVYDNRTGVRGWALFSKRPYKYINSYNFSIDDDAILDILGETKSPFRMLSRVPEDAVNLAYISQPDFSSDNATSFIDLSYKNINNVANFLFGDFELKAPSTGASSVTGQTWTYLQGSDTNDAVISSTSALWQDNNVPEPLYYGYLIGRGIYSVRAQEASLQSLRHSIKVIDDKGADIPFSDYPWDVVSSTTDPYGATLASGQFSAVLLTRYPFIQDKTIWVMYTAIPYRSGDIIYGMKEVIYPEPIFVDGTDFTFQYQTGYWNVTVNNVLSDAIT